MKEQIKKAIRSVREIQAKQRLAQTDLTNLFEVELKGAEDDNDADAIVQIKKQCALKDEEVKTTLPQQLKKSESMRQQLDKQLKDAAVHKQVHKEARRSLFVLSRGRQSSLIALLCGSFFSFCLCDLRTHTRSCLTSKASCTSRSNSWRSRWRRLLSTTRYAHKLGPAHCPGRGALKDDEERTVLLTRCWFVLLVC